MKNFNHNLTGFQLQGKHASAVQCRDCHQAKHIVHDPRKLNAKANIHTTFLGLAQDCLSCHQDEHQGQLSKDCLNCHTYDGWKPVTKFDHNNARFRLTGKHIPVDCAKCHAIVPRKGAKKGEKFTLVKFVNLKFNNCSACHTDSHNGTLGPDCKACHQTGGWKQIDGGSFNHSLTRFPLQGLHKNVACAKCHIGGVKTRSKMRFSNCTDCHKDTHFGQFADRADRGRCESCHNVFGFVPASFDIAEHNSSRYPLTGAHLSVPCVVCHVEVDVGTRRRRRLFEFSDMTCKGCHEDVHKGQFARKMVFGGCESCHQPSDWQNTRFDHNQSRFPLQGRHVEVNCRKCHKMVDIDTAAERILFKPMDTACRACHNDIHFGQFVRTRPVKTCKKCHSPASWVKLFFDHNRDSLFRLKGAHKKVDCAECHKFVAKGSIEFILFKPIDHRCVNCHG